MLVFLEIQYILKTCKFYFCLYVKWSQIPGPGVHIHSFTYTNALWTLGNWVGCWTVLCSPCVNPASLLPCPAGESPDPHSDSPTTLHIPKMSYRGALRTHSEPVCFNSSAKRRVKERGKIVTQSHIRNQQQSGWRRKKGDCYNVTPSRISSDPPPTPGEVSSITAPVFWQRHYVSGRLAQWSGPFLLITEPDLSSLFILLQAALLPDFWVQTSELRSLTWLLTSKK